MALVLKDRVKQTTTTTGTGSIVLNGNIDSFQTFAAALTDGDTTYYGIFEPSTNEYEVGLGTWTESSATLARTTVLESSNSGSAVSLTAQAEVFITQPAEKSVFQDANGDVDLGGNKLLFGNVYSSTGDLPSASTYHGMFAHVHGTGKGYFAHAGNWVELANQADVTAAVNALVDSAPGTLDTLNELAAALGDDANFSTTVTNSIATKLPLSGGAMTGAITTNSTFDGRDVATDGAKLDGIESGATADQTKADIDALGIAASTASTLATARNIAVTGAVTGNADFDGSGNISISTTATADPTVTLTGAVTGSGTMTNLGNVSIATTATADPTLTLSGDASGSATFTNLGNATLSVTVADDSHNHVISNVDGLQTALDGKLSTSGKAADSNLLDGIDSGSFLRSDANDTMSGQLNITYGDQSLWSTHNGSGTGWRGRMGHRNSTADTSIFLGSYGSNASLSAHNYALNAWDDLYINTVDGNSGGNTRLPSTTYIAGNTVWHAGNDGSGSGLDADTLDGVQGSSYLRSDTSDTFNGTLSVTGKIEGQGDVAIGGGAGYGYLKGYTNNWNHFIGSRMRVTGSTASPSISGAHDLTFVEHLSSNTDGFKFKSSHTGSFTDIASITRTGMTLNGGNLTLSGTGRIQGVDTVSSGTDATNKNYVDTAVSAAGVSMATLYTYV